MNRFPAESAPKPSQASQLNIAYTAALNFLLAVDRIDANLVELGKMVLEHVLVVEYLRTYPRTAVLANIFVTTAALELRVLRVLMPLPIILATK